jgi:RHS repeat-associated protein
MKNKIIIIIALVLAGITLQAQNTIRPKIACPNDIWVNSYNGDLFYQRTDMVIPNRGLDLEASFYYNSSNNTKNYGYGNGWSLGYEMRFIEDSLDVIIERGDGRRDRYVRYGNSFESPSGVFNTLNMDGSSYTLTEKDGIQYRFTDLESKRVTQIANRYGNSITLTYENGNLTSITDINGRSILFQWNADTLMIQVSTNFDDRVWIYGYDEYKNLTSVTNPMGYTVYYAYNCDNRIKTFTDEEGYSTHINYNDKGMVHRVKTDLTDKSIRYELEENRTVFVDYVPDGNNQFSSYIWDDYGRVIEKVGNCCGFSSKLAYDNDNNVIRREDANGHVTTYTYDQNGNMLTSTDALGNTEVYTYESTYNNVTSYIDKKGHLYTFFYDANGNLTTANAPMNVTTHYTYNNYGQVLTATDANNHTTQYVYDTYGNLLSTTDALGRTTAMTHTVQGIVQSITNPNMGVTQFIYNPLNQLMQTTDPLNLTLQMSYDHKGNIVTVTDALGQATNLTYNALGQPLKVIDPLNGTVQYTYNAKRKVVQMKDAMNHVSRNILNDHDWVTMSIDAMNDTTRYYYDNIGQVIGVELPTGQFVTYQYDALDRLVNVADQLGTIASYVYDANDNVISQTDAEGHTTTFQYDALNHLMQTTDAEGHSEYYTYDNNGNVLSYTDANGHTTLYTYDAMNQVLTERDALNNVTTYTYDANGNLASVTDARGNTTGYQYDANDQLIRITFANGKTQQFVYDSNGNMVTFTNESGHQIGFSYDALNRLTQKTYPDNNADSFTYDANGNMLTANNAHAQVSFTYDHVGRMLSETLNGKTTGYAYNTKQRTLTKTYPSGRTIVEEYDLRQRLSCMKENNNYFVTLAYNANDFLTQRAYGNGTTTSYVYNTLNQLVQLTDNSSIANVQMTYDAVGNMLSKKDLLRPTKSEAYTYDALNRLASFKQGEITTGVEIPNPLKQVQYNLDALGNRTTMTVNGVTTNYTANNMNAYTAITGGTNMTPQYDNNGNMTSDGTHTYQYNYNNRLISVDNGATATYVYDALNRRVQKVVVEPGRTIETTTNYYYCGDQAIEERDANNAVLATYIFGISVDDVLQMQRSGNTYYYHKNHLGSVVALTDGSGNLVERYEYDPYGLPSFFDTNDNALSQSAIGNSILFTGRDYDAETGLYYYRARTMHPSLGRFMQHDPLKYINSMNLFSYCIGNPLKYTDSYGNSVDDDVCSQPIDPCSQSGNEPILILQRNRQTNNETGGELTLKIGQSEYPMGYTLEPKGKATILPNQNRRIPTGTYKLTPYSSKKYPRVYQISGGSVGKDRLILMHNGNYADHTRGCVLVGNTMGNNSGALAVFGSRNALNNLNNTLDFIYKIYGKTPKLKITGFEDDDNNNQSYTTGHSPYLFY